MYLKSFALALFFLVVSPLVSASDYIIDTKDAHAFIQFKISHLGYSWVLGRFNTFEGHFSYDENDPSAASIEVTIDTGSIDTNHAERDKHLRGEKFLDADRYPKAHFISTSYEESPDGTGVLQGDFTLHGVTRPITINTKEIGAGMDPWGGYRQGFEGTTQLRLKDYGIDYNLGPTAEEVYLHLYVEGIREKNRNASRKR